MAQATAGLGAIAQMGARFAAKAALLALAANRNIAERLAARAYLDETGNELNKQSAQERTLWATRAQNFLRAISDEM